MPNSRQSSAIDSPPSRRATNCSLSSMTEHSFQGIQPSPKKGKSVTYVSGTICYLCVGSLTAPTHQHVSIEWVAVCKERKRARRYFVWPDGNSEEYGRSCSNPQLRQEKRERKPQVSPVPEDSVRSGAK